MAGGVTHTCNGLGEPLDTVVYGYDDADWGDLLTSYDGKTIIYDQIGNPMRIGTYRYSWEHGRQLASMFDGQNTAWYFTYDASGMRTSRTNGTTTYTYVYNGGLLSKMTVGDNVLEFAYDASGTPMTVTYNGTIYYYLTNIQGDVVSIVDADGVLLVHYVYDAWGNLLATEGTMHDTLGVINPLRYRGYVYDQETALYYLQSRYYNPEIGRFLNADNYISTGQGMLGSNMFAYCGNNPVNRVDVLGQDFEDIWGDIKDAFEDFAEDIEETANAVYEWAEEKVDGFCEIIEDVYEDLSNYDSDNSDVDKVYESNYFSSYNGTLVIRHSDDYLTSWAIGDTIYLNHSEDSGTPTQRENTLNHEYGHILQCKDLGFLGFVGKVAIPSLICNVLSRDNEALSRNYYNMPWEYDADRRGGVDRGYAPWAASAADNYFGFFDLLSNLN